MLFFNKSEQFSGSIGTNAIGSGIFYYDKTTPEKMRITNIDYLHFICKKCQKT